MSTQTKLDQLRQALADENKLHLENSVSLNDQIRVENQRHTSVVASLHSQMRQAKDENNANNFAAYTNDNVPGKTFAWANVVRLPRPNPEAMKGMELSSVALHFFNDLPDEVKDQLHMISSDQPMPRVVDATLLISGKDAVGQDLNAAQKRQLREAFRGEVLADQHAMAMSQQATSV